jgi:hypothetical protein
MGPTSKYDLRLKGDSDFKKYINLLTEQRQQQKKIPREK